MTVAAILAVTLPKFGLTMTEGKVASWLKAEGVAVAIGEEIADIETTKITNAYESPAAGVLRRHVAQEQEELPVGALIAIIADPAVPDAEIDAFVEQFRREFAARPREAEAASAEPRVVEVGGRSIRYLETGADDEGWPIILIHGFGGGLNNWLSVQPILSERHRVIALDLPGHGGSTKDVGAGDLATLSAAVFEFMQAIDVTKAHLVGHSLGGGVALRTALDHPAHVASLTLICPTGLGEEIDAAFVSDFITASRRKQLEPVLAKLFSGPDLLSRDMIEDVLRFKRMDGTREALIAVRASNFDGQQREVLRARLSEIVDIPVQVIWGAEDRVIPVRQAVGLPAAVRTHLLAKTGHMPHMEKASEVSRLLLDFVD
jgi:pyruvate dehydrogenase E2 component (dihydrolipoamide acetyltransferase)